MKTNIEQLADFAAATPFADLPEVIVDESKRLLLDSLGCALAGVDNPKGRIGIDYGRLMGGSGNATIIGTTDKVSPFGAAFANGELINTLDMDAVLPPGHVTPYVLPGALALAETAGSSGKELIRSIAVSHEISWRMGKAMDYLRDMQDGMLSTPPVFGYSSTIFGATAAIGMLQRQSTETLSHSLGIAGSIPPVQSMMSHFHHAPSTTIKYLMAGVLVQAAMTAAYMGQMGHRGDVNILDDAEYGFSRFIGTRRWEPANITADLGKRWGFNTEQSYKPYPHCRILHAPLDCLAEIIGKHDILPDEIDGVNVLVEGFVQKPTWLNKDIRHVHDAQFSIAHGIAVGAQRIPPGRDWQDPANVFSPSVMNLMNKVTHQVHPNYEKELAAHGAARPTKVEVHARGTTFTAERQYPRGSPSPDPTTRMTNEDLILKFRHNADGVLTSSAVDDVVDAVTNLERVPNFSTVMRLVARSRF
ncbi:MmgE/PrpD family protein [Burkholderia sp. Ax-1719]|uniref:MmgE/PrpD family protein n=1 Tax=Burkholderia sp. Ax-1719 TaxID=2608334 RepID=UPI001423277A|nr:MmgE/PrpD family protein [Burkholderia sp. Ax-1719]